VFTPASVSSKTEAGGAGPKFTGTGVDIGVGVAVAVSVVVGTGEGRIVFCHEP